MRNGKTVSVLRYHRKPKPLAPDDGREMSIYRRRIVFVSDRLAEVAICSLRADRHQAGAETTQPALLRPLNCEPVILSVNSTSAVGPNAGAYRNRAATIGPCPPG
jgi:hypothetical protein